MNFSVFKCTFSLVFLSLFFLGLAYAEDEIRKDGDSLIESLMQVDLGLFHNKQKNDVKPLLRITLEPKYHDFFERTLFIGSGNFSMGLEGEFIKVWDNRLDIEPSFIKGSTGLFWKLTKVKPNDKHPPNPNELIQNDPENGNDEIFKYHHGGIRLNAQAQVETDDDAENMNLAAGFEFVYSSYGAYKPYKYLPTFGFAYEYVNPTETEARDRLGADTSNFFRLRAFALWDWDIGNKLASNVSFVKNLNMRVRYRYAKEYDQSDMWKSEGYDEYDQTTAQLRYILPADKRKAFGLKEIYIDYSSGRLLPQAENDNRILLGVLIQ